MSVAEERKQFRENSLKTAREIRLEFRKRYLRPQRIKQALLKRDDFVKAVQDTITVLYTFRQMDVGSKAMDWVNEINQNLNNQEKHWVGLYLAHHAIREITRKQGFTANVNRKTIRWSSRV